MSDYSTLKQRLGRTQFLVVDADRDEVSLVNKSEAMSRVQRATAGLFRSVVVMDAHRALDNFARLVGRDDQSFPVARIATISGTPLTKANLWITEGVLVPSVRAGCGQGKGRERLFSWRDAFVAGICGSLRRQGMPVEMLRTVSRLFGVPATEGPREKVHV